MNRNQQTFWIVVLWMIFHPFAELHAQGMTASPEEKNAWGFDFRNSMSIPDGIAMASSEAHHYLLSESEGLVVFRIQSDSLQWLYTSSGMQARGNRLEADIRFAYLFGDTKRLTVLEPTSVLGVYSSTLLPSYPVAVTRIADKLYTATRDSGVVVIDLTTPESVDEKPEYLELGGEESSILDIVSDHRSRLFVLSGPTRLQWFQLRDKQSSETLPASGTPERVLEKAGDFLLSEPVHRLFLTGSELFATGTDGRVYQVASGGYLNPIGSVSAAVRQIRDWQNDKLIFTESGDLYLFSDIADVPVHGAGTGSDENHNIGTLQWQFNTGGNGDHFLSILENRLWIYQNQELTPLISPSTKESNSVQNSETDSGGFGNQESLENKESLENQVSLDSGTKSLLVSKIDPITVPFATPVLLPVPLEARGYRIDDLSFEIESSTKGAVIREGSFMWLPSASQTGTHLFQIRITAPDGIRRSTQFEITVRPFNRPPQFVPLRPLTLGADTFFETYFSAFDPDGSDRELVRYLGMDLPDGALLDEKTGRFTWTPTLRQTGSHAFRIIATDQYGAAAETSMSIQVVEIDDSDEYRFDPPESDSQNPNNPDPNK